MSALAIFIIPIYQIADMKSWDLIKLFKTSFHLTWKDMMWLLRSDLLPLIFLLCYYYSEKLTKFRYFTLLWWCWWTKIRPQLKLIISLHNFYFHKFSFHSLSDSSFLLNIHTHHHRIHHPPHTRNIFFKFYKNLTKLFSHAHSFACAPCFYVHENVWYKPQRVYYFQQIFGKCSSFNYYLKTLESFSLSSSSLLWQMHIKLINLLEKFFGKILLNFAVVHSLILLVLLSTL